MKFGRYGPQIYSHEIISYLNPKITLIEPLTGIQGGGTVVSIFGENLTLGNNHISIFIGNRSCQLLSISKTKIECETRAFPRSMLNQDQMVNIIIDHQTKVTYDQFFTVVPNPTLYSFDKITQYKSFTSGGHEIIIVGENFNVVQNIQLEFKHLIFISPSFYNNTHLIFLSPSIGELQLKHTQLVDMTIYLDNFNKTSSIIYVNDPIVYDLEPFTQPYTSELMIQGKNLTAIGHTKDQLFVYIGCELCTIIRLQTNTIICQPPLYRPEKYSKSKDLCYKSEHPSIIVSIDNVQVHIGFMIYPQKLVLLGKQYL